MTFNPGGWDACQAAKIAPLVVPYVQGRTLDIGSGPGKVWPRCIGIDPADHGGRPITDMKMDGTDLSMFADGSVDNIFSSFFLHQLERQQAIAALREWTRVLKVGGYLTLYMPNNAHCPKREEEDGDPLQKWNTYKGDMCTLLDIEVKCGWDLIELEDRELDDEFGTLTVVRKRADQEWCEDYMWKRQPKGALRCLVVRYGAIGDAIVSASILPLLKAQGYHVTYNTTPRIKEVLLHDPNIDEWLIQETDFVPNELLGPYWNALNERYDKIVNLSESLEGLLLALPGRLNHSYSDATRRKLCGHVNYLERTHDLADVPYDFSGSRFYPTPQEREWAEREHKRKRLVVVWCVNGSSVHKVYPFVQTVCAWLLERTPAHIVLYGDPGVGKELAKAILECLKEDGADMKRITSIAGKWPIRQSLAFAQVADVVVGSETGPLNAVSMEQVPKVIYLSHSSAENLTKHWVNTTVLVPNRETVPCYPCHRLHMDWTHCHKDEATGAALCASSIRPEAVFKAIAVALGAKST